MAHEVESLAYVQRSERDVPWHGLGTPVDHLMTAGEAMDAAGLDWEVECRPVLTRRRDGSLVTHDGQVAVMRTSDDRVYQITSSDYRPVQPAECFAFFDALAGTDDAKYDSVGSLRHGAVIFLAARLARTVQVGPHERLDLYLILRTSYDSSLGFGVDVAPIRPVCMNTVNLAVRTARQSWSLTPAGSLDEMARQAREALGLADQYAVALEGDLLRLANEPFTLGEFEQFARRTLRGWLDPDPAGSTAEQRALVGLFETTPTLVDDLRYTRYGALQTVVEHLDWASTPDPTGATPTAEERLENALGWSGRKRRILRSAQWHLEREMRASRVWSLTPATDVAEGRQRPDWPVAFDLRADMTRPPEQPARTR